MLTNEPPASSGPDTVQRPRRSGLSRKRHWEKKVGPVYDKVAGRIRDVTAAYFFLTLYAFVLAVIAAVRLHQPLSKPIGLLFFVGIIFSIIFHAPMWASYWSRVLVVGRTFFPTIFAVASIVIVDSALLVNYQGQEMLRRLAEDAPAKEIVSFFALSTLWFIEVWYVSRVMLLFYFPALRTEKKKYNERRRLVRTVKQMPRIASVAACVGLAYAMEAAADAYVGPATDARTITRGTLLMYAGTVLLLGGSVLAMIVFRRKLKHLRNDHWRRRHARLKEVGLSTRILLLVTRLRVGHFGDRH
ncbi:MAG TPA: hypothetical protein VGJ82_08655 [Thermoanaerobaculia bacterium]